MDDPHYRKCDTVTLCLTRTGWITSLSTGTTMMATTRPAKYSPAGLRYVVVCVYAFKRERQREKERGLFVVGIDFRGREIACLAGALGPQHA